MKCNDYKKCENVKMTAANDVKPLKPVKTIKLL